MRFVIIGSGAAGVRAAETLRQIFPSGEARRSGNSFEDSGVQVDGRPEDGQVTVTLVSAEDFPPYSRCLLPAYLAGRCREEDLTIRPRDFFRKLGINLLLGREALAVDPGKKVVKLADGEELPYDRLLIATGAASRFPPIPGIDRPQVFGLRHLADARAIEQACVQMCTRPGAHAGAHAGAQPDSDSRLVAQTRSVVVIGGGFVGVEAAYALIRRWGAQLEVTVVEKEAQILPAQFDAYAAGMLQREMEKEGIRFILGRQVGEIVGQERPDHEAGREVGDRCRVVLTGSGTAGDSGEESLPADLIIVAAGITPNTAWAASAGPAVRRGILIDDYLETSVPGIYAAGDVAEFRTLSPERAGALPTWTPIWPNASAQGRIAAYNMAGRRRACRGLIGLQNAVEFREVPAIAMGLVEPPVPAKGESGESAYMVLVKAEPEQRRYKKLVLYKNALVGMVLVGDISQAGVYGALLRKKTDVSRFADTIMNDNFNCGHLRSL